MAKRIPESYVPTALSRVEGGKPAVLAIPRDLSLNSHFLYGRKGIDGGCSTSLWNTADQQFTKANTSVTAGAGQVIELARFQVAPSLSGTRRVVVSSVYSGTAAAGVLRFRSANGASVTAAVIGGGSTAIQLSPGHWIVTLESAASGSGTVEMLGLSLWYSRREIAGEEPIFYALKQAAIQPDEPASSAVLQRLVSNQHAIAGEASSTIFSRWWGLPWTNATTMAVVGEYSFYVEDNTTVGRVCVLVRCAEDEGELAIDVNGVQVLLVTVKTLDGWHWVAVDSAIVGGATNTVRVRARKTKIPGEGDGVQVAAVCAWELPCTATGLGLPAGDTVPAAYLGNDTDAMLGFYPALASDLSRVNADAVWLRANARRMLVCDWRHRTGYASEDGRWACGVGWNQTGYDNVIPFRRTFSGGTFELNGSVLAKAMIPPSRLSRVEIWLQVCTDFARQAGEDDGLWVWELRADGATEQATTTISDLDFLEARLETMPGGQSITTRNYLPKWIGPLLVDRSSTADTELIVRARNVRKGGGARGAIQLYGMAIHDAHDGDTIA